MHRSSFLLGLGALTLALVLLAAGPLSPDKQQAHYTIQGPFCSGCVPSLKTLLEEVEGVEAVEIDVENLRVSITFDPTHTSAEALLVFVNEETTFDLKLDEVTDLPDDT